MSFQVWKVVKIFQYQYTYSTSSCSICILLCWIEIWHIETFSEKMYYFWFLHKHRPGTWKKPRAQWPYKKRWAGRKLLPARVCSKHWERKSMILLTTNSWKTAWQPWIQLSNILTTFLCCFCAFSQCAWSVFAHLHSAVPPNISSNETVANQYLARITPRELKCCLLQFSLAMKASFPSKLLKRTLNL